MFANPIFLFALLGAAVPILVHLIFRRQRKTMDFPTLMFLRRVEMKLASRKRLKEILLLALRALAIIFLALALARPGFRSAEGAAGNAAAAADCVLVIDNSASMGLKSPTGIRLDVARAQAQAILATLGAEGRAAIVTTVPCQAAQSVSTLGGDIDKLAGALEAIVPTNGSGSLSGALAQAAELLKQSSSAPNREIYLLSDFQGSGVGPASVPAGRDAGPTRTGAEAGGTSVFLCPVPGGAPERNLSLLGLAADPRPKVAGRRLSLTARVKNNSRHEISSTLSAGWRGQPLQQTVINLQPGAAQDVVLSLTLGHEGFAAGEVKLDPDDAAFDNAWPFCADVRGPIRVLVISPSIEKREELEESFYLRKALDPTGDGRHSGIRVTHYAQANAPQKSLEGFDTVILCGCDSLPAPALSLLSEFVERGGGMMIFAGRQDAGATLQKFLGGRVAGAIQIGKGQSALGLRAVQMGSPFFDDSRTLEGRVEFKDVAILKAVKIEPARDAEVLAEFTDGSAAILVRELGRGRVMGWTLSPNAEDSNLPLMPSFLSVLHGSISVLCNAQSPGIERKAGQPLLLDFGGAGGIGGAGVPARQAALSKSVTLYDPDEKSYEVPLSGGRLIWRDTARAGIYRLEVERASAVERASSPVVPHTGGTPAPPSPTGRRDAGAPSRRIPAGFAIVPDSDESATEYLTPGEAMRALELPNATVIPAGADTAAAVAATRQGRELFGAFIIAALLMVLAEALLANMLGTAAAASGGNSKHQNPNSKQTAITEVSILKTAEPPAALSAGAREDT